MIPILLWISLEGERLYVGYSDGAYLPVEGALACAVTSLSGPARPEI